MHWNQLKLNVFECIYIPFVESVRFYCLLQWNVVEKTNKIEFMFTTDEMNFYDKFGFTFSSPRLIQYSGVSGSRNIINIKMIGTINCVIAWSFHVRKFPSKNEIIVPELLNGSYNELSAPRTLKIRNCFFGKCLD